jgi:PBS lyase HEAT-like repeat
MLFLVSTAHGAKGETLPAVNADWLFDNTQSVVLGNVVAIRQVGPEAAPGTGVDATVENVELAVERCYKDANPCPSEIVFTETVAPMMPQPQIKIGQGAIVFLQASDSSPTLPGFLFYWPVPWVNVALDGKEAAGLSGKELLQADLATGLKSLDPEARLEAMHYLGAFRFHWAGVAAALWPVAQNDSTPLVERLHALTTLLENPKPEYVALVRRLAETEPDAVKLHPREAYKLGGAFIHVKDQQTLGDLIAIAQGPVETWHYGALYALRNLQDPQSVPALVKALDDPDREAEYQALITLALMTHKGGEYGPGIGPFDADPAKYIDLWKQWWETEGRSAYKP